MKIYIYAFYATYLAIFSKRHFETYAKVVLKNHAI